MVLEAKKATTPNQMVNAKEIMNEN